MSKPYMTRQTKNRGSIIQSSELLDTRQVHRHRHASSTPTKKKAKKSKEMSTPELSKGLSAASMLQRSDLEFIKTISCIRDSYYIFLGTTI